MSYMSLVYQWKFHSPLLHPPSLPPSLCRQWGHNQYNLSLSLLYAVKLIHAY